MSASSPLLHPTPRQSRLILLLLPLNGNVVPHLSLLVLLGDLLDDWREVSRVLLVS
jgi:hypothetical protein